MRSVVRRDADLGWQQLCPSTREQLSLAQLREAANATRADEAGRVRLTSEHLLTDVRPTGAQIHLYRVTAYVLDSRLEQRDLAVITQPTGCVEAIQWLADASE